MCPNYFTEGLEPYPKFSDYYDSLRDKTIYGTKWSNSDCSVEKIDPEEIETI